METRRRRQAHDRQGAHARPRRGRRPVRRTGRGRGEPRRDQGGAQGRRHGVRHRRRGRRHGYRWRADRRRDRRASLGALTVGVVTRPFAFEGRRRAEQAEQGIRELARAGRHADRDPERPPAAGGRADALRCSTRSAIADDVLRQGVQGITDLITVPGLVNLDFADVRTIMNEAGSALMGIGAPSGDNRAAEAAQGGGLPHRSSRQSIDGRHRHPAQRHRRP